MQTYPAAPLACQNRRSPPFDHWLWQQFFLAAARRHRPLSKKTGRPPHRPHQSSNQANRLHRAWLMGSQAHRPAPRFAWMLARLESANLPRVGAPPGRGPTTLRCCQCPSQPSYPFQPIQTPVWQQRISPHLQQPAVGSSCNLPFKPAPPIKHSCSICEGAFVLIQSTLGCFLSYQRRISYRKVVFLSKSKQMQS